ncbi:LacI family DNA-binding transcriptional regulator [Microbacterium aquilitoris]|uniref:LacI family DNA-binding transcriptional regulator n=1 Tax=Microbacterium aquilitoris TaxID=3067307 RepID=UPI00288CF8D9|nr:LacI family DNA-binding transcriptional regulator [Microbacterium sp. KSW2-22]MDT3345299.1 LacI family DNA-binding transcriptional regulator [Microbacterium sp. KSW2-22]
MSSRRATISDVAREAGVSASTASVVFSGKVAVSDTTRAKVMQAADALGYTGPDPRAASLRTGRAGVVAVLFRERLGVAFRDPVTTAMMDGLTDALGPIGAGILLLTDEGPAESGPTLTTAPLDAAILLGCNEILQSSVDVLRRRGIPVVVIEGDAGSDVPRVLLDNVDAQRAAAEHVRSLGHDDVALVTLSTDATRARGFIDDSAPITVEVTRDRLRGAREVFPDAPAYAVSESSIDEGLAAGRVLLAGDRPTAIMAQSDLLAAGVIRAAEEAGLRVPEDLSVTGFDGITVDGLAPYALTTLEQDSLAKGRAAGEAVVAMLDGRGPASVTLTCTFRRGNTTGPLTV